ncbi:hypothetical protein K438DRAFT_1558911 [Mycena galopus ATCC 62051]|nr:hypothetical protein K438DRAFT_1558911 [Mycena galopus ATCC 62051]
MGAKSCKTPPARRVEPFCRDGDESTDPYPIYTHEEEEDDGEQQFESGEEENGDATREASTGAKSCETPPARRVLFEILPLWRNADRVNRVLFLKPEPGNSIFTHTTDPFNPARVAKILEAVKIGLDLTASQTKEVRRLVTEHADIFTLSVGEVCVADGAEYAPRIPADATFSTRAC